MPQLWKTLFRVSRQFPGWCTASANFPATSVVPAVLLGVPPVPLSPAVELANLTPSIPPTNRAEEESACESALSSPLPLPPPHEANAAHNQVAPRAQTIIRMFRPFLGSFTTTAEHFARTRAVRSARRFILSGVRFLQSWKTASIGFTPICSPTARPCRVAASGFRRAPKVSQSVASASSSRRSAIGSFGVRSKTLS
jgi:hypothetical protein